MASDQDDSCGLLFSELVTNVEKRLTEDAGGSLVPAEEDLDLTELSLDSESCCQLSCRVTAANVADFGEFLELVLSQELGTWVLLCHFYYSWLGHITSERP